MWYINLDGTEVREVPIPKAVSAKRDLVREAMRIAIMAEPIRATEDAGNAETTYSGNVAAAETWTNSRQFVSGSPHAE